MQKSIVDKIGLPLPMDLNDPELSFAEFSYAEGFNYYRDITNQRLLEYEPPEIEDKMKEFNRVCTREKFRNLDDLLFVEDFLRQALTEARMGVK